MEVKYEDERDIVLCCPCCHKSFKHHLRIEGTTEVEKEDVFGERP